MNLKPALSLAAGAAGAASLAGAWAAGIEPHLFTVRRARLPILPAGARDLRVLHISDLHLAPWQRHKIRWVRSLAELQPDLVINTGDNFGWDSLPELTHTLAPLTRFPGAFVLGSNDYFGPELKNPFRYLSGPSDVPVEKKRPNLPVREFADGLTSAGWLHLDNTTAQLTVNGTTISFAGLGDTHMKAARITADHPQFALESQLRIGVTHSPYTSALDALSRAGAGLILAGHTHGGQVRIPGWGAPVTNCDRPHNEARGIFDYHGTPVHVSAGLGFSVFAPVRFACRPEVTLLTLTSASP